MNDKNDKIKLSKEEHPYLKRGGYKKNTEFK